MRQLSFSNIELVLKRKQNRVSTRLEQINTTADWNQVLELVQVVVKTNAIVGGASQPSYQSKDALSTAPV